MPKEMEISREMVNAVKEKIMKETPIRRLRIEHLGMTRADSISDACKGNDARSARM
jgi:hypothetical protein